MRDCRVHKDMNAIWSIDRKSNFRLLEHVSHDRGRTHILPRALAEAEWPKVYASAAGVSHGRAVQLTSAATGDLRRKRQRASHVPRSRLVPKLGSIKSEFQHPRAPQISVGLLRLAARCGTNQDHSNGEAETYDPSPALRAWDRSGDAILFHVIRQCH